MHFFVTKNLALNILSLPSHLDLKSFIFVHFSIFQSIFLNHFLTKVFKKSPFIVRDCQFLLIIPLLFVLYISRLHCYRHRFTADSLLEPFLPFISVKCLLLNCLKNILSNINVASQFFFCWYLPGVSFSIPLFSTFLRHFKYGFCK